ncbi:MAG: methyltransferase domain-containing protein [Alphaproteobacteria bacterium]|nr:methyltransferase domain-containing protein [Alphaproteobacteria bacterium]
MTKNQNDYLQNRNVAGFKTLSLERGGEKELIWHSIQPFLAEAPENASILDYGCGTGWLAYKAATEYSMKAFGYDPSEKMIETAQENFQHKNLQFSTTMEEAEGLRFDISFMIFVPPAINTAEDLYAAFKDVQHHLKPNGLLIVVTANPENVFYRHAYYEGISPENNVKSGTPYQVKIYAADNALVAEVTDYFWSSHDIERIATEAGFTLNTSICFADKNTPNNTKPSNLPYKLYKLSSASI